MRLPAPVSLPLHCLFLLGLCLPLPSGARERVANGALEFSVSVRQPEQLAAFYSARGLPPAAIDRITATCFVTVGIHNRSAGVVWLELANWRFETEAGQPVARMTREAWDQTWEQLNVPLAGRATFGWTQLPESRDLQAGEPVGGNVALVAPAGPFHLVARFRTGADGGGEPITLRVEHLVCPRGSQP
jgi:hypothetical protein